MSEGKRSYHLANYQKLAYTENADIISVTETWLKDEVKSCEILPWRCTIYRKGRKSGAGGVLLAAILSGNKLQHRSRTSYGELTSVPNMKYLLSCCYKSQQFESREWINQFNLFLARLLLFSVFERPYMW